MRRASGTALVMVLALAATPVLAAIPAGAGSAAAVEQADQAMVRGDWQAACTVLENRFGPAPDNVEIRVRLGECRAGLGRYGQAMADYRHVIARINAPDVVSRLLVLEMAELQGVITITDRPAALPGPIFSGEASLGVLLDSNANAGSSAEHVTATFGPISLPMAIDADSTGRADNALTLRLSGSMLQPLSQQLAAVLRGDASGDLYTIDGGNSRQSLRAGAGLLFRDGALSLDMLANAGVNLRGGAVERTSLSLGAQAGYALTQDFGLGLGGSVSRNIRPSAPDKDSNTGTVSAGIRAQLLDGVAVRLDYDLARTEAVSPLHSNWTHGPRIGVSASLTPYLELDLGYGFEMASYDASFTMFPQGRRDQAHQFSAQFTLDLSEQLAEGMAATLGYQYRHVDSTIELYQSNRHAISAGLSYSF